MCQFQNMVALYIIHGNAVIQLFFWKTITEDESFSSIYSDWIIKNVNCSNEFFKYFLFMKFDSMIENIPYDWDTNLQFVNYSFQENCIYTFNHKN